jgi:hypothetical protein
MYHTSRKSVKGKIVVKDILVHNFPIFPVEVIKALDGTIDESVTYIKLVFKSIDGEFKEVIIPSGAANDFKEEESRFSCSFSIKSFKSISSY